MNNGSLLDNLLATSSASTVNKKTTRTQKPGSATDGFQSTLDQVRPKVAARTTDTRANAADTRARATQSRSDAQSRVDGQSRADNAAVKRDASAQASHKTANRPERPENNGVESSKPQAPGSKQKTQADTASTEDKTATEQAAVGLMQPQNVQDTATGALVSGVLAGLAGTSDALGEGEANAEEDLLDVSVLPDNPIPEDILASILNPAAQADVILPPALASQIAGVLGSATGATPLAAAAGNGITSGLLNPDGTEAIALEVVPETEGEPLLAGGEASDSDNPDLLLLNSKSIMNKLAEANASSLDKSTAANDLPKALTAAAPAVESLSRLTEAQSPAARAFVVQTGVPVALGQPQWGQAVGERVLWLAAQNVSAAEIRLDPPELGPMQVRVSVHQDQVSVSFASPHPAVRDVLDQQLNRLREMFAEQGLNLGDVDVSDKSFAQQDQERGESNKNPTPLLDDEDLAPLTSSIAVSNRLVDHYA